MGGEDDEEEPERIGEGEVDDLGLERGEQDDVEDTDEELERDGALDGEADTKYGFVVDISGRMDLDAHGTQAVAVTVLGWDVA